MNAQKFGTKIGLNLSGINTDVDLQSYETSELLAGLNGGFVFDFTPKKVGIRIEALYSQNGYKVTADTKLVDGTTDVETDFSLNLDYIEIPILLKFKLGPAYLTAGPYFAYAVQGDEIVTMTTDLGELAESQVEDEGQIPYNDIFKDGEFNGDNITFDRTDFGLNIGAGVNFLMFFAEARYGVGLVDINDYDDINSDNLTNNYTITFSVGMMFGR